MSLRRSNARAAAAAAAAAAVFMAGQAGGEMVTLNPIRDNTLCESSGGTLSNGLGDYLFAGRTAQEPGQSIRRALLMFDLASIPADATVNGATLSLRMSRSNRAASETVRAHRLLASWGEGTSNASGQEGGGAPATTGDATWRHRFYNTTFWTTPGADFVATPSASTSVGTQETFYSWNAAQLVADVQGWLVDPPSNAGWILIGNESVIETAKRFDSRNISDVNRRPRLTIDFTAVAAWAGDTNGVWSLGSNWSGGVAPNGVGAAAKLGPVITAPRTVTLDVPVTLGSLTFEGLAAYTVAGTEALTFDVASAGGASINVVSGSHTITAPVTLADHTAIAVPVGSTLTIAGAISATGSITLTKAGEGRLDVSRVRAEALTINAGRVTVLPSGTSGATSVVRALTLAGGTSPTATLDLNDNALVVDYETTTPLPTVAAQIASAYGNGSWNGAGVTSALANGSTHGLGYGEASALATVPPIFGTVDATAVLVRFTRYGDADLNGSVNLGDFNRLAANFGASVVGWIGGDFDYNGSVNLGDFNRLAANFGLSAAPGGPTAADWAALAAAVPEPVALAPLAGAVMLVRSRTRASRASNRNPVR